MRHLAIVLLFWCQAAQAAPPLLVIALDGFRHDFAERGRATHILALQQEGASVRVLIPSFPSTTFPNFHSMATGLHPERHGIVAMAFHDRLANKNFYYAENGGEGAWYGGTPIWELAEARGIRTAACFWPGTDAGIHGKHPSYYRPYDGRVSRQERVKQVEEWLRLPETKRPHFVIVYFSDVDSSGHRFGPDAPETRAAIAAVDEAVGELARRARALAPEINIVVLSDHGQIAVKSHIDLSARADFRGCTAANEAPMTMLYCEDPERVRRELVASSPDVHVWRRREVPRRLRFRNNPRIGDLIVTPKPASIIEILPPGDAAAKPVPALKGMHGYDPFQYPEMAGILIGAGPAFRRGAQVKQARTVDVFALFGRLLEIDIPASVDADFSRVRKLLR